MSTILQEPWGRGCSVMYRLDEVLLHTRTHYQDLLIGRCAKYGLCLFLDDLIQSAQSDEALYHEPFVHPAMVIHGSAKRILIGGAGEGATARELLRHDGIERIVAVDLDEAVIDACRTFMPTWSAGAFDDPRVELRIEPIQHTLGRAAAGSFDVVLLDVTDPVEDGPSVELFTARFFEEVARVLADDGIVVLQSGQLDLADLRLSRSVIATLREVFGWVRPMMLHVPSFHGCWSATLASKRPREAVPVDLEARVDALRGRGLQVYDAHAHRSLLHLPPLVANGLRGAGKVITGEDEARLITFGHER